MLTFGIEKVYVADQMGHTSTKVIGDHYGKWINEDAPGMGEIISESMGFSAPVRPQRDHKLIEDLINHYKSKN